MTDASAGVRRVLVLGGTSEAAALARALAAMPGIAATLSLAGRTRTPAAQALPVRIGGFGGVAGLRRWLVDNETDCVIDATHPFAAQMAAHAALACVEAGVRRAKLLRTAWQQRSDDLWTIVADLTEAVIALGSSPRRVFLPIGRNSLTPFAAAPFHHYLVRSIDVPGDLTCLPHARAITARPPFTLESERALLRDHAIEIIVAKNSGGPATQAKLVAARALGLPVILVAQPHPPAGRVVRNVEDALAFIRSD